MAMILTESGFVTQPENKPESMFKVGDLIRPTINNQFDGMSIDEIWEVVEVNGYDRMNGYIYTIKPNNDTAKAYRSENSTDGEAEGFAEIAGFENSPEEQAWTLAESKSMKESKDVYFVRKEEPKEGMGYWWNIRPAGSNYIDRYLGFDFDEVVDRYKKEHSIKNGTFELEKSKSIKEDAFDYDETSEEDQGLFDSIGTQVVDTLFPGIQFEANEMEKLDEAIDLLIWVYKSVKSRSVKTTNESIDNKHYKNVNTVNGKNVVAAHLSSEHKEYNDTYLGYVSFELDDGSEAFYPVDMDGNLVDDKNVWAFIKEKGLPEVTFGSKVIKESKDIDTLLDMAGGKDEVEQRIIDALRNYPNADAEELAEILEDDNLSYDDWTSIIEYLDIDF